MEFVSFEIAKKLKEKEFTCEYPFAMYSKYAQFCPLYSSEKFYFEIDDFDEHAYIAPTISQVLKWLRKEKDIHIEPCILADADTDGKVINEYTYWSFSIQSIETGDMIYFEYEHIDDKRFNSYEQAALAGIEYIIDNMI